MDATLASIGKVLKKVDAVIFVGWDLKDAVK
jgi:hypothetical protein